MGSLAMISGASAGRATEIVAKGVAGRGIIHQSPFHRQDFNRE